MGLMIETFGLTRKFANLTAVEDLSIQVRKGEILGFLGPNGAGKTTTIKIMVGQFYFIIDKDEITPMRLALKEQSNA